MALTIPTAQSTVEDRALMLSRALRVKYWNIDVVTCTACETLKYWCCHVHCVWNIEILKYCHVQCVWNRTRHWNSHQMCKARGAGSPCQKLLIPYRAVIIPQPPPRKIVLQIRTKSAPLSIFIVFLSAHIRRAKRPLMWPQTSLSLHYMHGSTFAKDIDCKVVTI